MFCLECWLVADAWGGAREQCDRPVFLPVQSPSFSGSRTLPQLFCEGTDWLVFFSPFFSPCHISPQTTSVILMLSTILVIPFAAEKTWILLFQCLQAAMTPRWITSVSLSAEHLLQPLCAPIGLCTRAGMARPVCSPSSCCPSLWADAKMVILCRVQSSVPDTSPGTVAEDTGRCAEEWELLVFRD